MATEYTTNKIDEIYFLNDKNIAQSLSDDISFNPIPSLSLLNTVNDNLIKKIDNDIQDINSNLTADNGEFITGIKQESGKLISITTSKLTDDFIDNGKISISKISGLTNSLDDLSSNYVKKTNFKTSTIDNDKGFVTGDQLTAKYWKNEEGKPFITIQLDSNIINIACDEFIKDGMINEVKVDVDNKNLIITWNTDSKKEDTKIPLSWLANIYNQGYGIDIDSNFNIKIDDSIVVTHNDFKDTETYVNQLKSGIINELSNDVKDSLARLKHTVKFDGIIEHYEGVTTIKELFDSNTDYNGLKGSVRNNSLYKVNISENNKYNISSVFDVEGLSFTNSDYLFINGKTDENQIPTNDLKSSSIYVIKTGVSKIDFDTEIFDRILNDTNLSNWCDNLSVKLDNEISNRISVDTDLINWCNNLSNDLSNEINYLSSIINTKTSISSDDGLMLGLTIKRISEKDYHDLVINGPIDISTLYIVSSDITDVYGERIINLQDPIELSDAVNKKYVDEKVGVLKDNIVDTFNSDSELSILLTDDSLSDFSIENIKKSLRLILTTLSK